MSEDLERRLLPVSLIKQYHFCPRIIYFTEVLGVRERTTEDMVSGREEHDKLAELDLRRKTLLGRRKEKVIRRWVKLEVASERLGLAGVIDLVALTEGGLVIVEYKRSRPPKRPPMGHICQAAAYAMLAEEHFNKPVRKFYIHYDGKSSSKTFEFTLTEELREHVMWTVKKIRSIIEGEWLPRPERKEKCVSCGYYKICKRV